MNIDIGCGGSPKGDVNIDLFYKKSPHTSMIIKPKKIKNFVIADANKIPFRNEVFYCVYCFHVLEHLINPTNCLKEIKRIMKFMVIFKVPNNPILIEYHKHLYSWSITSFNNLLMNFFESVEVYTSTNLENFRKRRILRILKKIPSIERIILRFLSKILAMEIIAICKKLDPCTGISDSAEARS